MIGAAVATILLFYIMAALIRINAERSVKPPDAVIVSAVIAPIPKETKISTVAKLRSETLKLIEPVSLPPAVATKTSRSSIEPPQYAGQKVVFTPSHAITSRPSLSFNTLPNTATRKTSGLGGSSPQNGAGITKGYGDTDAIGGNRQCTIIFEVGQSATSITNMEWIDCMNGEIVVEAEQSLYKWVEGLPPSYTNLQPTSGDKIEFTFEQR